MVETVEVLEPSLHLAFAALRPTRQRVHTRSESPAGHDDQGRSQRAGRAAVSAKQQGRASPTYGRVIATFDEPGST